MRIGNQFAPNVTWLARVLSTRRFPLERLVRDLELAEEVVAESLPQLADEVTQRLRTGARLVGEIAAEDAAEPDDAGAHRLQRAYLAAILAGRPSVARQLVERAVDGGLGVRQAYLEVLQPALYETGELWASGRASVAQEHLVTATTQILVARLAARLPRTESIGRRAIVSATDGELHALGTRFVADFLAGAGWEVLELGASTPPAALVTLAARERPDAVALSTTLTTNLGAAEQAFAMLSRLPERPLLVAGGRAYGGDEALARRLGADLFAPDAAELVERLEELTGR